MNDMDKTEGRTRRELIRQSDRFWTDSRGIRRNQQLTRQLNLIQLEILDHGYFIGNRQWNQFDVMSPFGRVYYMIADAGWLETGSGRLDLLPGFMYLIPPYTRVNLRTDNRIEKFYFHFTFKYAGVDVLEGINRCFRLPLDPDLLQDVVLAYSGGSLPDLLRLRALAGLTLARFLGSSLPDLSHRLTLASTYREVNAYIEQHLSARLTGEAVCAALGLSYETTRRAFRRDNGITFNQYIKGRLIQEASMRLLLTNWTIQRIAASLGFADEFYFSRLFKQKMEYSPREYRRINAVLRGAQPADR
jgi:AraC-like DNA-binding protein